MPCSDLDRRTEAAGMTSTQRPAPCCLILYKQSRKGLAADRSFYLEGELQLLLAMAAGFLMAFMCSTIIKMHRADFFLQERAHLGVLMGRWQCLVSKSSAVACLSSNEAFVCPWMSTAWHCVHAPAQASPGPRCLHASLFIRAGDVACMNAFGAHLPFRFWLWL